MAVIQELIRTELDGSISFGNYLLTSKSKIQDFEHKGDLYKVKTFQAITKLERNGMFCYESVPGTAVEGLTLSDSELRFKVEGSKDAQITIQMGDDSKYEIFINNTTIGQMKTNISGKLVLSVELSEGTSTDVRIVKI